MKVDHFNLNISLFLYLTGVETGENLGTEGDENQPIRNRLRDLVDKMSRLKRRMSGVVEKDTVAKPGRKYKTQD